MRERWQVEWIKDIPSDENGDAILDAARTNTRVFSTEARAVAFAEQVDSFFGVADVVHCREIDFAEFRDGDEASWCERGRNGNSYWTTVGRSREVERVAP